MEIARDKIREYIINDDLKIEKIMHDYNNYIYIIIRNMNNSFSEEDIEEIILDVYLTLWNNKQKLDINKSMSAYIVGITKKLILKKCRNRKQIENIEDYEEELASIQNIELDYLESQKNQLIVNELEKMKKEDKDIFIYYYYEQKNKRNINYF